ncbi:exonuclease domain-containing protein [Frigoribacterium sp. UYMn621]|uniref:exonuclease domain-containing protein n=1 Tax=Frigoribacterium sp. UYMn621 TaxID=3156343 RepID=UPI00339831B1
MSLPIRNAAVVHATPRMLVFDIESTGIDVYSDRIVTLYLGMLESDGTISQELNWVINPGVDIPTGASDIHGYTTARVQKEGRTDIPDALGQILWVIETECLFGEVPLAGYNLSYDITLLESERARHLPGHPPLDFTKIDVLDGLVLDKGVNKYRKGSRKLVDTAKHYGVPITAEEAHEARADAVASGRIIQKILASPSLAGRNLRSLHSQQISWKASQAASLQAYFRGKGGKPDAVVDPGWPLQSRASA